MPESTSSTGAAPKSTRDEPRGGLEQSGLRGLLVQVRDMTKSFRHGTRKLDVLRGVNLTLREGEMVTIIGASGAGKSTLLHCLGTLDLPSDGEILFWPRSSQGGSSQGGSSQGGSSQGGSSQGGSSQGGSSQGGSSQGGSSQGGSSPEQGSPTDITRLSPPDLADFRNRTIGFVFQFHHLLPEFTALENVMMPALIARMPVREARQRAEAMLDAVAMSHRLAHRPGELSGGEQQRVAIARALVMQPRLLLADEPTGNLDTRTSAEVHELLFRLNAEHALSMLVVTHNMELAEQMPRVVRMADGRILEGAGDAVGE